MTPPPPPPTHPRTNHSHRSRYYNRQACPTRDATTTTLKPRTYTEARPVQSIVSCVAKLGARTRCGDQIRTHSSTSGRRSTPGGPRCSSGGPKTRRRHPVSATPCPNHWAIEHPITVHVPAPTRTGARHAQPNRMHKIYACATRCPPCVYFVTCMTSSTHAMMTERNPQNSMKSTVAGRKLNVPPRAAVTACNTSERTRGGVGGWGRSTYHWPPHAYRQQERPHTGVHFTSGCEIAVASKATSHAPHPLHNHHHQRHARAHRRGHHLAGLRRLRSEGARLS